MADYSAEITALKGAIASGATHVSYDGKTVDYDSFEKMLARLRWLEEQNGAAPRATAHFASFDRGDF